MNSRRRPTAGWLGDSSVRSFRMMLRLWRAVSQEILWSASNFSFTAVTRSTTSLGLFSIINGLSQLEHMKSQAIRSMKLWLFFDHINILIIIDAFRRIESNGICRPKTCTLRESLLQPGCAAWSRIRDTKPFDSFNRGPVPGSLAA